MCVNRGCDEGLFDAAGEAAGQARTYVCEQGVMNCVFDAVWRI